MAKEDFTTLWVKKVTATKLTATGEGTTDERINRLIDEAKHSKKSMEELDMLLQERTITVPCASCGTEGIVLNGSEVHKQIRNMAKLKLLGMLRMCSKGTKGLQTNKSSETNLIE